MLVYIQNSNVTCFVHSYYILSVLTIFHNNKASEKFERWLSELFLYSGIV